MQIIRLIAQEEGWKSRGGGGGGKGGGRGGGEEGGVDKEGNKGQIIMERGGNGGEGVDKEGNKGQIIRSCMITIKCFTELRNVSQSKFYKLYFIQI